MCGFIPAVGIGLVLGADVAEEVLDQCITTNKGPHITCNDENFEVNLDFEFLEDLEHNQSSDGKKVVSFRHEDKLGHDPTRRPRRLHKDLHCLNVMVSSISYQVFYRRELPTIV